MKHVNFIFLLFLTLLATGCDLFKMRPDVATDEKPVAPIARVNEKFLYPKDIVGIVPKNASASDSADIVERYLKSWIKKQLMIAEASRKINFNETELERKILDYRYALMIYEFEKYYINQELSNEVTPEEIEAYYQKQIDNFLLKQNIIQGKFVRLPIEAPKLDHFRKMLKKDDESVQSELKSYCYRFASNYSLEDSLWLNFDEVILNTPWASLTDKAEFLKENKFAETTDDHYIYFLKINNYKKVNEVSPLEFVKDQISNIIINKRKVELSNQLEDEIYKRATENNDFKIYTLN